MADGRHWGGGGGGGETAGPGASPAPGRCPPAPPRSRGWARAPPSCCWGGWLVRCGEAAAVGGSFARSRGCVSVVAFVRTPLWAWQSWDRVIVLVPVSPTPAPLRRLPHQRHGRRDGQAQVRKEASRPANQIAAQTHGEVCLPVLVRPRARGEARGRRGGACQGIAPAPVPGPLAGRPRRGMRHARPRRDPGPPPPPAPPPPPPTAHPRYPRPTLSTPGAKRSACMPVPRPSPRLHAPATTGPNARPAPRTSLPHLPSPPSNRPPHTTTRPQQPRQICRHQDGPGNGHRPGDVRPLPRAIHLRDRPPDRARRRVLLVVGAACK
jgi:hypothetical protein